MEKMVFIDNRGRLVIPREIREIMGIEKGCKAIVKVKNKEVLEVIILSKLRDRLAKIFNEKFRDWREDEHEASKFLSRLVG